MQFCRICLQSVTLRTVDLDATLDAFYDELMYYDVIQHEALTVCTCCEHSLRKAYNFRQKCRRAHILLKIWSKDVEKKVALNFLGKLLPKNPINIVTNNAIQKVFTCTDSQMETDTTTEYGSGITLVPIHYKQEEKRDIRSYYQEFIPGDTELKETEDNENKTNDFDDTANDFENDNPNKSSDNESDDNYIDNFDDFFKNDVKVSKKIEDKENIKENRRERLLNKRKQTSRSFLIRHLDNGLLKDLGIDSEIMLKWFDQLPTRLLLLKGMLSYKHYRLLDKWRQFFSYLKRRFDPKYEAVYDIEFLETHEQKVAEFVARQHSEQFIKAACKCFICFKVFPRYGLLEHHNKTYHDESLPIKCDICLCGFQNKKQYITHVAQSHDIAYRCKRCPYIARCREIMRYHYEEHINNGISCKVCGKQFRKMKTMNQHMLCHKRGACCPFCGRSYALEGLVVHVRCKHKDDALFKSKPSLQCPECDLSFHYENALNTHLKREHTEYRCSCGEVFIDEMSLTTHTQETKHVPMKTEVAHFTIRCDICAKEVPNTSNFALIAHHRKAHPSVPYVSRYARKHAVICEVCGLACKPGSEYEDHLNTHSGVKPYECSECGERFAARAEAERHLKIHIKQTVLSNAGRQFECDVCAKVFTQKRYLKIHLRIHDDFKREIVTSRVIMPEFKNKTKKPNTITEEDTISKNNTVLQYEETSSKNYGSEDNESDESMQNYENLEEMETTQGPDPSMEVIYDFENEFVEEIVL